MSEYQYYEFQAIDHPLTDQQIRELRAYSSRAEITSASFTVEYNWGDFKGNPHQWMEKYFDAFVHVANWGTRWLMLRVPKQSLDVDIVREYCVDDYLSCSAKGQHVILSFRANDEEPEWIDGQGWLASLIQLRTELMRGDYRSLYLGWLSSIQGCDSGDDDLEPPLPPGLRKLRAPLERLAEFLCIDFDLIAAAAEESEAELSLDLSKEEITKWVVDLPLDAKHAALARVIDDDDPHAAAEFRLRAIREIRAVHAMSGSSRTGGRRTSGQLLARAQNITQESRRKEAERASQDKARRQREHAEQRRKHLESLRGQENELWTKADNLINTKQPKRYDEAISILQDLRDVTTAAGNSSAFFMRMGTLFSKHESKRAFVERLQKASLLSPAPQMALASRDGISR